MIISSFMLMFQNFDLSKDIKAEAFFFFFFFIIHAFNLTNVAN